MRRMIVSVLILAAVGSSVSFASAQPGLSGGNDLNAIDRSLRIDEDKRRARDSERKDGLAALQAGDFAGAEKNFAKLLSFEPTTSDASYLMGVSQIGLEKWPEAKQYLEVAVTNEPQRAEPKARLGVAHIMLGDINSAADQHDALSAMWAACNQCTDAKSIADSLTMLDKLLVAVTTKKAAG
jgi:TolA-binding protein